MSNPAGISQMDVMTHDSQGSLIAVVEIPSPTCHGKSKDIPRDSSKKKKKTTRTKTSQKKLQNKVDGDKQKPQRELFAADYKSPSLLVA